MELRKPAKLCKGDTIATISPSWGCAGNDNMVWRYRLGKERLEKIFGLKVIPAPNSMRGEEYLSSNPKARAEDVIWAFENNNVKGIIANIGGNDSINIIPYIDKQIIHNNPKILIGYSDVLFLHLLCYKAKLSSFYGHNLLTTIAESKGFHPYSQAWFKKVLFSSEPIGIIPPAQEWTCDKNDYSNRNLYKKYHINNGYKLIQGNKKVQGRLIGGHTHMKDIVGTEIDLTADDFMDKIFFIEEQIQYCSPQEFGEFFIWLGSINALQKLKGIIIGKFTSYENTEEYINSMLNVINEEYGMYDIPILCDINFGHSLPICVLPYGALAQIDCENVQFSIIESGVI